METAQKNEAFRDVPKPESETNAILLRELASPVTEPFEEGMAVLKEAKERADASTQRISLIGVVRMIGDPTVQSGLRFAQALLDVVGERKKS